MSKNESMLKFSMLLLVVNVLLFSFFPVQGEQIFAEPDIIKDNVSFWKKIYSEVSIQEGLLHDREYPMVIYEKIDFRKMPEKERHKHIDSRKKFYTDHLNSISKDSILNEQQKELLQLFKTNASVEALSGAESRIRFQLGQKERFQMGLERSFRYLDTISSILKKYGLPDELKYLPHVESSFDPEAYSRVGAAGMWQFMRSTGKLFMTVNYDIDERLDPIKSTDAAARLLNLNYQHLQSWPLAITAYNHGLAGMKRAVTKTGSNNIAVILQKHESPTFKFASKNFYASFLAAKRLADSAFHYFPGLVPQQAIPVKLLTISSMITPAKLCKTAGISLNIFKQYNPAIRPNVYSQQKRIPSGYTVSLPDSILIPELQNLLAQMKPVRPEISTPKAGQYVVKKGDNLTNIARKHGISTQELAMINSIEKVHHIYEGQELWLPDTNKKVMVSDSGSVLEDTAVSFRAAEPPADSLQIKEVLAEEFMHDSTDNDSLTDLSDIAMPLDSLDTTLVSSAGLVTKATEKGFPEFPNRFDTSLYDLGLKMLPGSTRALISVNIGESVVRYAEWMNIAVASIIRSNDMKNYRLKLGKQIGLPVSTKSDLKRFKKSRLEYLMAIEEDFYSRYQVVDEVNYTLKRGETFWKISSKNRIPLWLLKKRNRDIDFSSPKKDITIRIPKVAAKGAHEPPVLEDAPEGEPVLQIETFESLQEVRE